MIGILSLCISIAGFFVGYFIIPVREQKLKAESEFVTLFRGLIEDYYQYQNLSSYNGTPLTEANKVKEKILANCELMILSVKRSRKNKESSKVINSINSFSNSFTDNNFNQVISTCKSYINRFHNKTSQQMNHDKPHTRISILQVIKEIFFFVLTLIAVYLFALNGRYEPLGGNEHLLLDKWSRKCYYLDPDKIEFRTVEQDIKDAERKKMKSDEYWEQYRVK